MYNSIQSPLRVHILTALPAKLLISLNLLSVALASLPPSEIVLTPPEKHQGIFSLVYEYFQSEAETALRVIKFESAFDRLAKNPSSSASGLFQITKATKQDFCPQADLFDVEDNIRCAFEIFKKRGWKPWNSSRDKWDNLPARS